MIAFSLIFPLSVVLCIVEIIKDGYNWIIFDVSDISKDNHKFHESVQLNLTSQIWIFAVAMAHLLNLFGFTRLLKSDKSAYYCYKKQYRNFNKKLKKSEKIQRQLYKPEIRKRGNLLPSVTRVNYLKHSFARQGKEVISSKRTLWIIALITIVLLNLLIFDIYFRYKFDHIEMADDDQKMDTTSPEDNLQLSPSEEEEFMKELQSKETIGGGDIITLFKVFHGRQARSYKEAVNNDHIFVTETVQKIMNEEVNTLKEQLEKTKEEVNIVVEKKIDSKLVPVLNRLDEQQLKIDVISQYILQKDKNAPEEIKKLTQSSQRVTATLHEIKNLASSSENAEEITVTLHNNNNSRVVEDRASNLDDYKIPKVQMPRGRDPVHFAPNYPRFGNNSSQQIGGKRRFYEEGCFR